MMDTSPDSRLPTSMPGSARLMVVAPVALLSFFYATILEYCLPLYFGTLGEAAQRQGGNFPNDLYSKLAMYQMTPWIVGPALAGLLARRYGERRVWSFAQLGMVVIPLILALHPSPVAIRCVALWSGITVSLMWIGGVSLVQMVPDEKKGLSNGLMLAAVGVGGLLGPIIARATLYHHELGAMFAGGDWRGLAAGMFSFTKLSTRLQTADFFPVFGLLMATTTVCGVTIGLWGQRPGRFPHDTVADWHRTMDDLKRLFREPRFWALVVTLCILGGPVFQATNQFLPYRAEDLGLKSGSQDHGWIGLTLLRPLMWIVGGLAVGLVAGRRAAGVAAVTILGCFAVSSLAIGLSVVGWQLFVFVATFEFARPFMRWSHAGYMSENMPGDLRAAAIGVAIASAGLGSTIYGWTADYFLNPETQSAYAFYAASTLGIIGAISLFVFNHFCPIRSSEASTPATNTPQR